jgi:hypothetical protein
MNTGAQAMTLFALWTRANEKPGPCGPGLKALQ